MGPGRERGVFLIMVNALYRLAHSNTPRDCHDDIDNYILKSFSFFSFRSNRDYIYRSIYLYTCTLTRSFVPGLYGIKLGTYWREGQFLRPSHAISPAPASAPAPAFQRSRLSAARSLYLDNHVPLATLASLRELARASSSPLFESFSHSSSFCPC